MKIMDNTIKYYELLMKYDDISDYKKYELPSGFHYEMFKDGDEIDWVNIHIESGEFTSIDRGLKYFHMFTGHLFSSSGTRMFLFGGSYNILVRNRRAG